MRYVEEKETRRTSPEIMNRQLNNDLQLNDSHESWRSVVLPLKTEEGGVPPLDHHGDDNNCVGNECSIGGGRQSVTLLAEERRRRKGRRNLFL